MSIRLWNPFVELANFENSFRSVFDSFSFNLDGFFTPLTDVEESKDGYTITMNVPGIKADELTIEATSEFIEINTEFKPKTQQIESEQKEKDSVPKQTERISRKYYRKISFTSPVDPSTGKVSLQDGVLTINIQKRPEAKKISLTIE